MSILEDILEKHARKNDVDLSLIHEIIETQKKQQAVIPMKQKIKNWIDR